MSDSIDIQDELQPTLDNELSLESLLELDASDPKALHEQAAELTRRRLLLAAMECFAEKGFHKASIREIARRAGLTMGAVYHHFSEKKDLLMKLNRSRQIKSNELLSKALAGEDDFFEALRAALEGQFHFLASNPLLRGLTREYVSMALVDADVRAMHSQADVEFERIASAELDRRYPRLDESKRTLLIRMLYVSFEGLITAVVADSPLVSQPGQIVSGLVDAFRREVEAWRELPPS